MALTKATITNLDTGDPIHCLFNPTEYTIAKTNSWQTNRVVGKNVPKLDFTGGEARTMQMELFFDVLEKDGDDVSTHIDKLWELTMTNDEKQNPKTERSRPPLCLFQWGGSWHFKAAVTSLSVRYTLFRESGIPCRAVANITLQEAEDPKLQKGTNPTSYAEPGYRRREVRPHDSLPLIAYEEYGDSAHWRLIAEANLIDDPESIRPGQVLAIPALK
jgi:nucleoid-associated protein YgaU